MRDWFVQDQLGIEFYDYQTDVSDLIIKAVLLQTGEESGIEISRQAGKTEAVVCTACFLLTFTTILTRMFWGYEHALRIIIWSPQKEQAKTDFDRLKSYLGKLKREKGWGQLVDAAESNQTTLQLSNKAYCYIFPLTPTSNPESKTADLQIFEEAHKIPDIEKKNKAEPMGASTNAPEISIGVAWYNKNYFYELIENSSNTVLKFPAKEVIRQRRKKYLEDGNKMHLMYEKAYTRKVRRDGRDDPAIQTQWDLKWRLEAGTFITRNEWDALTAGYEATIKGKQMIVRPKMLAKDLGSMCYAGIDTAKNPDSTVVTIIRVNRFTGMRELIALLELQGENYWDQFEIITGYDHETNTFTGKGMFQAFNVEAVAIDSTGQGSFMPDTFHRLTKWKENKKYPERGRLFPVTFTLKNKDLIYTILQQSIKSKLTAIPNQNTRELRKMKQQLLQLEKEYKGNFLSVHHPEADVGQEFHDDYPDSWALAEYAYAMRSRSPTPRATVVG